MQHNLWKVVLLTLFVVFTHKGHKQEPFFSFLENNLDSVVQAELKRWDVPGLSLGIILNDTVRYNKGFGVQLRLAKKGFEGHFIINECLDFGIIKTG